MQDRVPTYPGRVQLTPVSGQANTYDMVRADEPTQAGDALSKKNLLPDEVEQMLRLSGMVNPQIKDAFISLALGSGKYGFAFTVKYSNGSPAKGVIINGVTSVNGSACITDANGKATGVSTTSSVAVSIDMTDVVDVTGGYSATITAGSDLITVVPNITVGLQSTTNLQISSSRTIKFSSAVDTVDCCAVGGGGGGGGGTPTNGSGNGGGGGYVNNALNTTITPFNAYSVVVGAAGVGGARSNTTTPNPGTAGGASSVASIVSASGGSIGSGNGAGGYRISDNIGCAATNGSGYIFNDNARPVGGGGGWGQMYGTTGNSGGTPYGGAGGVYNNNYSDAGPGGAGRGPGGGGGGGGGGTSMDGHYGGAGGNGYPGQVYVRWRYKA